MTTTGERLAGPHLPGCSHWVSHDPRLCTCDRSARAREIAAVVRERDEARVFAEQQQARARRAEAEARAEVERLRRSYR